MRFVAGAFAIFLTSLVIRGAAADDKPETNASPPETKQERARARAKVPLRVVRILRDSNQALLYDRTKAVHVLAAIGETVAGYTVEDVDDDAVTLSADGVQFVLAVPDAPANPKADTPVVAKRAPAAPPPKSKAPEDPYEAGAAPEDPYPGLPSWIDEADAPVTSPSASAPASRAPGIAGTSPTAPSTSAPPGAPPELDTPTMPTTPAASTPGSATTPVATTPAAGTPGSATTPVASTPGSATTPLSTSASSTPSPAPLSPAPTSALSRREVDAALSDFAVLTTAITGAFTATGAQLDAVAAGSVFAKAGLRAGDLIASVDGRPLRSLDDAAELYARASTARLVTVQVVRGGKPTTLRVTIH